MSESRGDNMCDSSKCDKCGEFSGVLIPEDNSWRYLCPECYEEETN